MNFGDLVRLSLGHEHDGVPCIQCGYCCKRGTCGYGAWNPIREQCTFLTADNRCSRYDEIVELEKDSKYPMMGCGCSSPLFNEVRDDALAKAIELGMELAEAEEDRIFMELVLTARSNNDASSG